MTTFHTRALYIPPSPLGLVGNRWIIEHHCDTCRQPVAHDDLIAHARTHEPHDATGTPADRCLTSHQPADTINPTPNPRR